MELAAKLQIKAGQRVALVSPPDDVELDLGDSEVAEEVSSADVVLIFIKNTEDLERVKGTVVEAGGRDALTWVAYPKGGQLGTDLNRDRLWELLSGSGIRPVRQIAIDETWSALRFRPDQGSTH